MINGTYRSNAELRGEMIGSAMPAALSTRRTLE